MEDTPEISLPPKGTRGVEMPKLVQSLAKGMSFMGDVMFRVGLKVQGRPLIRLETVGARTGKHRHTVLGWFPDEERAGSWIVVASNAGSARHPGWAHNLAAHPTQASIDEGEGAIPVDAELIIGDERDRVWDRVVETSPGYGRYLDKTDREIPIFRLTGRP